MLSRCLLAGSLGLYVLLLPPLPVLAQRASGTSAGGASGFSNNSSSTTPIGVPTLDAAYINLEVKNDIMVKNLVAKSQKTIDFVGDLASNLTAFPSADSFQISSAKFNTSGTVGIAINGLSARFTVETLGAVVPIDATVANIGNVRLFAAAMILSGVKNQQAYASGSELVGIGVSPIQAAKLLAALSRFDDSGNPNQLASCIDTFNSIVNQAFASNAAVLAALASNADFQRIQATLKEKAGLNGAG